MPVAHFPAHLGYAPGEFIISLSTPSTCPTRLPLSVPFTHTHPDPLTFLLVALGPGEGEAPDIRYMDG